MATLYVAVEEQDRATAIEDIWYQTPPKRVVYSSVQEAISAVEHGIADYAIVPCETPIPQGLINPRNRDGKRFKVVQLQDKPETRNDRRRSKKRASAGAVGKKRVVHL
ncbi:MAG: hypothetical protein HYT50_01160 [Candidatus Wildermuthbacteria bacterium]|nr:hypothetical protein [Candidatus Wildermuthbacteria bacterium]